MTKSAIVRYVSSLPVGEYRTLLGAIRRAWKSRQTGAPVKRLRRTIRQDARDIRWAHDVRDRDRWMCRRCGAMMVNGARIEAAHIVPRRYIKTRHDLMNGLALCRACHRWAHEDLTAFVAWVREEIDAAVLVKLFTEVPSWKGWRTQ